MRTDERRAALLVAARDVFVRSGFAGTTVRDVAKAAGIDHVLVYRHFDSKVEIFEAALVEPLAQAFRGWAEFAQRAAAFGEGGAPDRERGAAALARIVKEAADAAPLLGVVLFSEHGAEFYREHLGPALDEYARGIDAIKDRWDHRAFDADLAATVVVGSALLTGLRAMFEDEEPDFAAFTRALQDLMFDGLLPRP